MTVPVKRVDAVTALTAFLVLRYAVPSSQVIGPLGGAGSPAAVFGLFCLGWWAYHHLQRTHIVSLRRQSVRRAAFFLWMAYLASYITAMTRPLDAPERTVADLGVLTLLSWLGVLLLAHDGIPTWTRAIVLIRRMVLGAALMATLGILQSYTHTSYVDQWTIPGLSSNSVLGSLSQRGGFARAAGTALHAIEFGSVLTMMLPFAVALAIADGSRNGLRRWTPVLVMSFAATLTVTRSALLGGALALLIVVGGLPAQTRRQMILFSPIFIAFVFVTKPGLVGTLLGLFTNAGSDSSVESRTGSYSLAWEFVHTSPLFGRGPATFIPSYRILDNQYLLLSIEVGAVGLIATLALLLSAIVLARRVRRHSQDPMVRLLAQACFASVGAGGVELALFDGFSFPMFGGMLFLVVGLCGAFWRLQRMQELQEAQAVASRTGRIPDSISQPEPS